MWKVAKFSLIRFYNDNEEYMADLLLRSTGTIAPLRFITVDLTETANAIGKMHGAEAWTLNQLAEYSIASLFLSASLKYPGSVSIVAEYSGDISRVQADTTPAGLVRAMIPQDEIQKTGDFELLLAPQVMRVQKRDEHAKLLSEGIVNMVSTRSSQNTAVYLFQSEQLKTAVGIEARPNAEDPSKLDYAAGFYLEAFPDATEKHLIIMEQVVKELPPMSSFYKEGKFDVHELLDVLAGPVEYKIHQEVKPQPFCPCDKERTLKSVGALDSSELKSMLDENKSFEVVCDFCRTPYEITPDDLQGLISQKQEKGSNNV
jgi:molecular chaperone Hsp33